MDKDIRNILQRATQDARRLLEEEYREQLEGTFDILLDGTIGKEAGPHLDAAQRLTRQKLVAAVEHNHAAGITAAEAVAMYLREAAFTTLNRFAALKMLEARGLVQECISKGEQSTGFKEFCGLAPGLASLPDKGYRLYIENIFDEIGREVLVLFNRLDAVSLLWPRRQAFNALLDVVNQSDLASVWVEDETIGWVYQYFNSQEERRQMRDESSAPRNSRELAVRNQFFTPRYVVEFLTDNTLGRIWYEMRQGDTVLKDQCRYLVRRPNEVFLGEGEETPAESCQSSVTSCQKEQTEESPAPDNRQPATDNCYIPFRPKKDPREIHMLDPAGGSGHFGLYCFDLFQVIYTEAYEDADLGPALKKDYPDRAAFLRDVPRLILANNIHIIDIDPRAVQIAGLALWLRAQRANNDMNIPRGQRPAITRTNVVVAEPMPGEKDMFEEFLKGLREDRLEGLMRRALEIPPDRQVRATKAMADSLCALARIVWESMSLAGEAGSLLKIEDDIAQSVRKSRSTWEDKSPLFRFTEFSMAGKTIDRYVKFLDGDENDFWESAEQLVLAAMKEFAQRVSDERTVSRRLFADDAVHGFAFIDVCRKHYDVVLMNPPFGAFSRASKDYVTVAFKGSANDIFAAFVDRFLAKLVHRGMLGAITSRTGFFIASFADWRRDVLRKRSDLLCFADLGGGVMDNATVEAAAYVLQRSDEQRDDVLPFLRLLVQDEKQPVLAHAIAELREGRSVSQQVFWAGFHQFELLSDAPFVYWASATTLRKLGRWPAFEPTAAQVRKGLRTGDNFRFVRTLWEIPQHDFTPNISVSDKARERERSLWVPLVLSGSSQPWFSPLLVVLNWKRNGQELRQYVTKYGTPSRLIQAEDFYFKAGMSWTLRTTRFVPYAIPAGCIPTGSRPMAFPKRNMELSVLAVSSSRVASAFMRFYGDWFTRPKFLEGKLKLLPWPELSESLERRLDDFVRHESRCRRSSYQGHEPFFEFIKPFGVDFNDGASAVSIDWSSLLGGELEAAIETAYGLESDEATELYQELEEALTVRGTTSNCASDEEEESDEDVELILDTSERGRTETMVSYALGCTFGRWDIRYTTGEKVPPELVDPFAPLPVCPPGQLQDEHGLPISQLEAKRIRDEGRWNYPIEISWDGIFVDDPGHPLNIETRVHQVLEVIWKERWESIAHEASEILGVSVLRDYFRKSASFFADHIKRYSKSRRKAPIYWQLAIPAANYSVWLYYHRFTKDTFYKILNDFVVPKVRHEERKLTGLIQESGGAATSNQRKDIADQEAFVEELRAFRDEVGRIAPLWNPNLNDGVIINFAPLWRLVPQHRTWQKECKHCWDKLVKGDYDWAHLAMHLWPERVVPKCAEDRSLAIAHGLDEVFWEEDNKGKSRPQKVPQAEIDRLIQERTSPSVKMALGDLLSAPVTSSNSTTRRTKKRT